MRKTLLASALAMLALTAVASPVAAAKGGGRGTTTRAVLIVPDGYYGETVTAIADPGRTDVKARVYYECRPLDSSDTRIDAAYYEVVDGVAVIGPLWVSPWPGYVAPFPTTDAACRADLGYFRRDGFGRWVSLASTTFRALLPV